MTTVAEKARNLSILCRDTGKKEYNSENDEGLFAQNMPRRVELSAASGPMPSIVC